MWFWDAEGRWWSLEMDSLPTSWVVRLGRGPVALRVVTSRCAPWRWWRRWPVQSLGRGGRMALRRPGQVVSGYPGVSAPARGCLRGRHQGARGWRSGACTGGPTCGRGAGLCTLGRHLAAGGQRWPGGLPRVGRDPRCVVRPAWLMRGRCELCFVRSGRSERVRR